MKYYKVLGRKGEARIGAGRWPLPPKRGGPGKWKSARGELIPCENGLHLCRRGDLITWLGPRVFEAEYDGEKIVSTDKVVVRKARLVRELNWNDSIARLFAADCAERALRLSEFYDERSWNAIHTARAVARGDLPISSLSAAWSAAWYVAWSDAGHAARSAAWSVERSSAWYAAWSAAGSAAGSAERKWQTRRLLEYLEGKRK